MREFAPFDKYNITEYGEKYCLYRLNQVVMIFDTPNGDTFFNQTNCVLCDRDETTGWIMPLVYVEGFDPLKQTLPFENCEPHPSQVAEFLDSQPGMKGTYVYTCKEAWVTFAGYYYGQFVRGVLTWQNCD